MTHAADTRTRIPDARHIMAQALAVLVPPLATLAGMQAGYAVVDVFCRNGHNPGGAVHAVRAVTLAVILGAGVLAWREWDLVGMHLPGNGGDQAARARLLSWIGVFSAALFSLVVIAQWLPAFFLDFCQ